MRRSTRVHRDRLPLACGNSGLRPGYSPVAFGLALVDDGGTSDLAGLPTSARARPAPPKLIRSACPDDLSGVPLDDEEARCRRVIVCL